MRLRALNRGQCAGIWNLLDEPHGLVSAGPHTAVSSCGGRLLVLERGDVRWPGTPSLSRQYPQPPEEAALKLLLYKSEKQYWHFEAQNYVFNKPANTGKSLVQFSPEDAVLLKGTPTPTTVWIWIKYVQWNFRAKSDAGIIYNMADLYLGWFLFIFKCGFPEELKCSTCYLRLLLEKTYL